MQREGKPERIIRNADELIQLCIFTDELRLATINLITHASQGRRR
jgi:hypothetical protein